MTSDLMTNLYVFMLAAFIGFEVIRRVSPLLHTPLMSLTNALDAIAVVGAIVLAGEDKGGLTTVLATVTTSGSQNSQWYERCARIGPARTMPSTPPAPRIADIQAVPRATHYYQDPASELNQLSLCTPVRCPKCGLVRHECQPRTRRSR